MNGADDRAELLGRARELALLDARLEDALDGLARTVLLRGEAGMGKTRLAEALAARAEARGAVVVTARSVEEGGAPEGWLAQELVRALAAHPALAEAEAPLAHALESLSTREADRFAVCEAVADGVSAAAARAPLVAIVEDLHWADSTSLVVLKFVARRSTRARLLLCATTREEQEGDDEDARRRIAELARAASVLDLGALEEPEGRVLAERAGAPPALAARVHHAAGGNPLFTEELARHLVSGVAPRADADLPVPESLRVLVDGQLAALAPSVRTLLARAALLAPDVDLTLLRAVTVIAGDRWSEDDLAVARARRLLIDGPRGLRFRHEALRQVARARLADPKAAHRAIASALEAAGADAETLAPHLLAAEDPRGVPHAIDAARAARARLAYERAAGLFALALDASAGAEIGAAEIALRLELGEVLLLAGHRARGAAACRMAAAQARRLGDPALLARAALALGAVVQFGRVDQEHVALLEAALAAVGHPADVEATLRARLAAAMQPSENPEVPLALARGAIASARALGDRATLARVLDAARPAFRPLDDLEERIELDRECAALAIEGGDPALRTRSHLRLAADLLQRGDLTGAEAYIDLVASDAARREPDLCVQVSLTRLVHHLLTGRFEDAGAELRAAAAHQARVPDPFVAGMPELLPLVRARLLLARARLEDEAELARLELSAPPPIRDLFLAVSRLRLGDVAASRAAVQRLFARGDHRRLNYLSRAMLPAAVAELGEAELAAAMLPLVRELGDTFAVHPALALCEGAAPRLRGMLLATMGRTDEAYDQWMKARAMDLAAGARPFVHEGDLALGEHDLARGDRRAARERLVAAAEGFAALGMTARLARAQARLAGLEGSAPAPPLRVVASPDVLATLRRDGEVWALAHAGAVVHLRDAHGLRYLAHLLEVPGAEVHVSALSAAIRGRDAHAIDAGDAGPVLDEQARRAYRARIADLRERIEEATLIGDTLRAERARSEIDALAAELAGAFGLGGRPRKSGSTVERQRVNVTLRIRKAIRKIAEVAPLVADHLDRAIATGTFCSYDPPPGPRVTS